MIIFLPYLKKLRFSFSEDCLKWLERDNSFFLLSDRFVLLARSRSRAFIISNSITYNCARVAPSPLSLGHHYYNHPPGDAVQLLGLERVKARLKGVILGAGRWPSDGMSSLLTTRFHFSRWYFRRCIKDVTSTINVKRYFQTLSNCNYIYIYKNYRTPC